MSREDFGLSVTFTDLEKKGRFVWGCYGDRAPSVCCSSSRHLMLIIICYRVPGICEELEPPTVCRQCLSIAHLFVYPVCISFKEFEYVSSAQKMYELTSLR